MDIQNVTFYEFHAAPFFLFKVLYFAQERVILKLSYVAQLALLSAMLINVWSYYRDGTLKSDQLVKQMERQT